MPALPKVLNRSSSSSDEVMSAGSNSLTSSYRRYPFSLPIVISCRIPSYFSPMTKAVVSLVQFLEPPEQLLLAFPQRHERAVRDFRALLEPVDFVLYGGAFAVYAGTAEGGNRGGGRR